MHCDPNAEAIQLVLAGRRQGRETKHVYSPELPLRGFILSPSDYPAAGRSLTQSASKSRHGYRV